MATMTMYRPPVLALPWTRTASNETKRVDTLEMPKSSIWSGLAAYGAILAVGLFSVLAPALGPPNQEAQAVLEAREVQTLAHSWVAAHPADAPPTGDARAWGFQEPPAPEACTGVC
jgi:hypothetical protein